MRLKIAACAFAMGTLIVVSVFAQDPSTKTDNASQTTPMTQARQPQRIHVKEDVQEAKLVDRVSPLYPPLTDKRVDGTVVLHVVIGKSGAVNSARYVSGPTNLLHSAVKAVLQWRYKPTSVNGVAVEVDTTVSVVFPPLSKQVASEQPDFPFVSVLLPADIASETVQISYFLIGPFGGYGDDTRQQPGLQSYDIPAVVEGKAASEIRMIVYASGCEIKTLDFPLTYGSRVKQKFECKRAATVHLAGQIVPAELATKSDAELVVNYMAYWAHEFFGIRDGRVTEFQLATVSPDSRGAFQVELPYLAADIADSSSQQRASFSLTLRDSKSWNPIAYNLEPQETDLRTEVHSLTIRSHYPDGLKFKAPD